MTSSIFFNRDLFETKSNVSSQNSSIPMDQLRLCRNALFQFIVIKTISYISNNKKPCDDWSFHQQRIFKSHKQIYQVHHLQSQLFSLTEAINQRFPILFIDPFYATRTILIVTNLPTGTESTLISAPKPSTEAILCWRLVWITMSLSMPIIEMIYIP